MVYILHFNQPYHHARHYVGYCDDGKINERLMRHRQGRGARLIEVITQAGIGFQLARVWCDQTKAFERQLKRRHGIKPYCPLCCQTNWRT